MARPIKDPVDKIETTVNQMLTKFSALKRMADLGHLREEAYGKVKKTLCQEMKILDTAVENYAQPELKLPFTLNDK